MGEILAKAYNTQRFDNNAGVHAEMNAVKIAGKMLDTKDLRNCDVYSTCEPCIMCLAVLSYAKVKKIFFGSLLHKVSSQERMINIDIDTFIEKLPHKPEIIKQFMEKQCKAINDSYTVLYMLKRALSSAGRTSGWQPEGQEFESPRVHKRGGVKLERLASSQKVAGSSPTGSTYNIFDLRLKISD